MSYRDHFFISGEVKERLFAALIGGKKLNRDEDLLGMDIELRITFDVKGMKKIKRSDAHPQASFHWVEIKKGDGSPGWVVKGSDYLVFELEHTFLIIARERLMEHVKANLIREYVKDPEPYKLYNRRGQDCLTLVPVANLKKLGTEIGKENAKEPI